MITVTGGIAPSAPRLHGNQALTDSDNCHDNVVYGVRVLGPDRRLREQLSGQAAYGKGVW